MNRLLLCMFSFTVLLYSCKKDNGGEQGYNFTTAYKNDLNVRVLIQQGRQYKLPNGKDTTGFYIADTIEAGKTKETTYFVCTKNCPVVYSLPAEPLDFTKMIIGDKVKIDTNCSYYYAKFKQPISPTCGTNAANFFDQSQWLITKDRNGNIIRKEYVIDQADLAEAK